MNTTKLIEIEKQVQCDIGAPIPAILSDEYKVYLFYHLREKSYSDGKNIHVRIESDTNVCCITFTSYAQYKTGNPNDEAIEGHPYYNKGLHPYGFFKVINSDWIRSLEKMNRVHPYHSKNLFEDYKHYIYFFHDSCFEIVCTQYEIEVYPDKTIKDVLFTKAKS